MLLVIAVNFAITLIMISVTINAVIEIATIMIIIIIFVVIKSSVINDMNNY